MLNLGELVAYLKADWSSLDKGEKEARKFSEKVEQHFDKVSRSATRLGKNLTIAVTLPIAAAGAASVKLASDLEETRTKTDAIFKANSKSVKDWAKTTDKAYGLSERAALDYASRFGGSLKEVGKATTEEAAQISKVLVGLTSDLNSFFNREDAGNAIASALTGEFEALKKFNVVLNELTIKEEALALGVHKGTGQLSLQAKQLAVLSLLQKQTTDAQGDFLRTSDGLANKSRILKAQLENQAAAIGERLLPLTLKIVNAASKLLDWWEKLSPTSQNIALGMVAVAAAAGPVLLVFGQLVVVTKLLIVHQARLRTVMMATWTAVLKPVAIVAGLLAALGVIMAKVTGEFDNAAKAWDQSLTPMQKTMLAIRQGIHFVKIAAQTLATGLLEVAVKISEIPAAATNAWRLVQRSFVEFTNFLVDKSNEILKSLEGMFNGLIGAVIGAASKSMNGLLKVVENGINKMVDGLNVLNKLNPFSDGDISKLDLGSVGLTAPKISLPQLERSVVPAYNVAGESAATAFLKGLRDASAAGTAELLQNIPDGSDIKVGAEEAAAAYQAAAAPVMDLTNLINNASGAAGGLSKEAKKARNEIEQAFKRAQEEILLGPLQGGNEFEQFDREILALQAHHAQQLELINQAEQMKLDAVKPYHELREQAEKQHQDALAEIRRARMETALGHASTFFGNLAQLQNSESKKAQKIGKAAAIAKATVDTYTAATGAYAAMASIPYVGPVLGAAAAGAAIAAGFANIQAIRSAKATGGEVFAGGNYRVNENGPEMLSTSAGDFLMMGGGNGKITPFEQLGGSSGGCTTNVKVDVFNYGSSKVEVEETGTDEEKRIQIFVDRAKQAVASDIRTGGNDVASSIEDTYRFTRTG